jgi:hypothetical protein
MDDSLHVNANDDSEFIIGDDFGYQKTSQFELDERGHLTLLQKSLNVNSKF